MTGQTEDPSIGLASFHEDESIACEDEETSIGDDLEQARPTQNDDNTPKLASSESKAVGCFRVIVLVALVLTATAVSYFIYHFMRQTERDEFEMAAASHATKLMDNFHAALETKLSAINTLSASITSYSLDRIDEGKPGLPFCTMPNFPVLAADTRVQAQAVVIVYAPLVRQGDERIAWETYSSKNRNHLMTKFLEETKQIKMEDARYNQSGESLDSIPSGSTVPSLGEEIESDGFHPRVHYLNGTTVPFDDNDSDWTMPFWDISPAVPAIHKLNYDASRHPVAAGATQAMYKHKAAVLDHAIVSLTEEYDKSGQTTNEYSAMFAMGQ